MAEPDRPSVAADVYDERYYSLCEGYDAYAGEAVPGLSTRLETALGLAGVEAGIWVLDLGWVPGPGGWITPLLQPASHAKP
jgi:hypothetical protein